MLDNLKEHVAALVHTLTSASRLTYTSIGVSLLVAFLYFKIFFQDSSQFREDTENTVKLWLVWPFRWLDKYTDFEWSRTKVLLWLGISVGSGILAHHQLPAWLPNYFR